MLTKSNLSDHIMTIDTDWAPDSVIHNVSNTLIRNHTKATWFVTHQSPVINRLSDQPDLFEIGVHPNFCEGSTQGSQPHQVMKYVKDIVPNAQSVRTHRLVQSSDLLKMMRKEYGIMYDASILLSKIAHIKPYKFYFEKERFITRIPYFWEDDVEMFDPDKCFDLCDERYHVEGLKIFNFHPVCINKSEHVKMFFEDLVELLQSKGKTIKELGEVFNEV